MAWGACHGVGSVTGLLGTVLLCRGSRLPEPPPVQRLGWGPKPSMGAWPGARAGGLPAPTGASVPAFPLPGRGACDTGQERHGGGRCLRRWPCFTKGRSVGGHVSADDPGQVRVLWVRVRVWPLTRPAWPGPLRSSQRHFPVELFPVPGFLVGSHVLREGGPGTACLRSPQHLCGTAVSPSPLREGGRGADEGWVRITGGRLV